MSPLSDDMNILERVDAAVAVVSDDGSVWRNGRARSLLGSFSEDELPALLADPEQLGRYGLSASVDNIGGAAVYTVFRESPALTPDADDRHAILDELHERDRRRELLISICLVCAYSQGTLDGIYYAVSETARLLGADCAALFLADNDSRTWKSICLCTADGDNAGYSVRTDIPFDEFKAVEKRLDEKSCMILTGLPEARMVSGEPSAVCAARVSAEKGTSSVLWLERRDAPDDWARAETAFIYILLGVLKMALRRSRMERELKDALRDAYEANAAKSEFFSSVSHEIRTPINAVLGMTALALDSNDPDEVRGYLEKVNSSGLYLLGIINDILDISCIEAGKFSLSPHDCSLRSLLGDVCDMISFAAEKKGLQFILEVNDDLPEYIFCDEQRLRQVLINLLNNAVKFTERGFVSLSADRLSGEAGDMLVLTVADTGAGIAPEDHDRIFSAYERLDGNFRRGTEGSGLGLRITQSIVDMMGGRIELSSTPGEGSIFTVTLPVTAGDPLSVSHDVKAHRFAAPKARVLAVDDSDVSLMVTTGMLKKFGIQPDTARNGQIALDMSSVSEYNLILMDHMMPVMDGETACRRIRTAGVNMETPIVALTANVTSAAAQVLYDAGMNDILTKPLFVEQLGDVLLRWLPEECVESSAPQPENDRTENTGRQRLDINDALRRMGGSRELFDEALTLTLPAIDEALTAERRMLESGDMAALRIDAHGLKGVLNTIGAYDTAELALRLERCCAEGDICGAQAVWDEYEAALGQLSETIAEYLDNETQK